METFNVRKTVSTHYIIQVRADTPAEAIKMVEDNEYCDIDDMLYTEDGEVLSTEIEEVTPCI